MPTRPTALKIFAERCTYPERRCFGMCGIEPVQLTAISRFRTATPVKLRHKKYQPVEAQ